MKDKELEVGDNNLGYFKISRNQAQSDYKINKKEIRRADGTTFKKKTTTINDEKIADTCVEIFQQSQLAQSFNYNDLREKAIDDLSDKFLKYNIVEDSSRSASENKRIDKIKEIAITQYIKKHIEENVDLSFYFGFDEFIEKTGIKSAKRVGVALKLLDEVQSKSFYEWKEPNVSDDFSEINYELTKMNVIPAITLILDEEMGEKFETIKQFADSDIKNKKRHIKGVKFEISKSYLPNILGLGRDYTQVSRKNREKFNSSYSYRLETLIRSIEKVQHIPAFNRFTENELQSKFGTEFKEYKNFKSRVLNPSIKDINEHTNLFVELKEKRKNDSPRGDLQFISFNIQRKLADNSKTKFGIDSTAFYISSRLFYFSNENIKDLLGFARHVEQSFGGLDVSLFGNKYLKEWREECEVAIKCERELIKLMESYRRLMKSLGLAYDDKRMCIVEIVPEKENKDSNERKNSVKIIQTAASKITNPQESIEYLSNIIENEVADKVNIFDYMPFKITLENGGWADVKNITDYQRYEEMIKKYIVTKKVSYFYFDEDSKFIEEVFAKNIMRENFAQIDKDFKKMIMKLTGYEY